MTMRQVTGNMTSVVKGMDKAMETMNLERVRFPLPYSLPPFPLSFVFLSYFFPRLTTGDRSHW